MNRYVHTCSLYVQRNIYVRIYVPLNIYTHSSTTCIQSHVLENIHAVQRAPFEQHATEVIEGVGITTPEAVRLCNSFETHP